MCINYSPACSLRWSTSCLTSADDELCVASASCCNSGMLEGLCARQSHHIAHPRYSAGKIKLRTSALCGPCAHQVWHHILVYTVKLTFKKLSQTCRGSECMELPKLGRIQRQRQELLKLSPPHLLSCL
jgi:hypothetical protein